MIEQSPELKERVSLQVERFRRNPTDTRLDNHDLKKEMSGQWAFSITGDIRIVYEWLGRHEARFLAIGGHEEVYGI